MTNPETTRKGLIPDALTLDAGSHRHAFLFDIRPSSFFRHSSLCIRHSPPVAVI